MFDIPLLVLGDVMLDKHVHGHVRRISPEAPVPVVGFVREDHTPGGAGNVAATLAGLGCQVTLAGLVGADTEGNQLREALRAKGVERLSLLERLAFRPSARLESFPTRSSSFCGWTATATRRPSPWPRGAAGAGSALDRRASGRRTGGLR